MTLLSLQNLSVTRAGRPVLDGIGLELQPGICAGLIGRNGAGKTTLMRAALGLERHTGQSSLAALPAAERARRAAFLPQERRIAWPVSVERLVALGRIPHLPAGRHLSGGDAEAVERALTRLDLQALRHRPATQLSGGEQARVLIARALAQDTPLLMADEPTAGLDPAHQLAAMELFAQLAGEGRSVLLAIHDLGLAARYCSRLILLDGGRIAADGPPADVLRPDLLQRCFGIRGRLEAGPSGPSFHLDGRAAS